MKIDHAVNLEDVRRLARRYLPKIAFDFIEGGVDDELGLARNRQAFTAYRLLPRYLRDVGTREQSVALLGRRHASPFGISATGLAGLWRPGADRLLAAAARRFDVPFVLSNASNDSLEEVVRVAPEHVWFQMYCTTDPAINVDLLRRAATCGVEVLVLTVDVPVGSNKERNRRNGFTRPLRMTPGILLESLRHPVWLWRYLRAGGVPVLGNWVPYAPAGANADDIAAIYGKLTPSPFVDWDVLRRIRDGWKGRLVVKGVLHADDAKLAVEAGADGLIVSNHGGRQLDIAPSPLEVLAGIRAAVGGGVGVILESGVRRGSDVVLARCLGADAAFFGRPPLHGVAAAGQAGVEKVLEILRNEVDLVQGQIGCSSFSQLDSSYLLAARAP